MNTTHSNATLALFIMNEHSQCVYMNAAAEKLSGFTLNEARGQVLHNLIHSQRPDGSPYPLEDCPIARTFSENNQKHGEGVVVHKDGHFSPITYIASPLREDNGMMGTVIEVQDLTQKLCSEVKGDLKQSEIALQESQAQLQQQLAEIEAIYHSAPVGLNVLDTDLRFVRINERLAQINGIPVEDHIGRTVREVLPHLADSAEEILRPIIETGEPRLNVEIRGEMPSQPGVERVWLEHFLPLKDNNDQVIGISTVCEEITEQKHIEESLRESGEYFRTLADNIPQLAWMADEIGWIFWYNRRWFEYSGTTLEDMQGWGWQKVHHPDYLQRVVEKFSSCIATGEIWEDTFPLRSQEGDYRWFLSRAIPIRNEEGKILRWFGTNTDITERLQAEEEREHLLKQEQAARAEAEAANRIKDEFLAVLSHELRTPLNPILGWAKLLQTRNFDEARTAQALATIERNAKLQAELIEDLLDVSRILRGALKLKVRPVNLVTVLYAAMETVRLAAQAKSISLHVRLKNLADSQLHELKVSGDSARLQQILWNILSNAVKFTPEGGRVDIEFARIGNYVEIIVSDTGKGISPDFFPYIFDYFRQAEGGINRRFGGLGLGLAIVRHLVELHGGTVWAESSGLEQGTTFTVRLPLISTASEVTPKREVPEKAQDLTGIQIVVVEDEVDSRELVSYFLEMHGATVTSFASAREALYHLTYSQPNVVISDIGMPDMDGYEFIQQVRQLSPEQGGEVGAIALTAYVGETDYQQAMSAGFQEHLAKPIEPSQLLEAILNLTRP